jgi:putative transcriptional regulator
MVNRERGELEVAEKSLKQAGFALSQPCISRASCFDYVARKGTVLLFVKVQRDLAGFSTSDAQELRLIAESVSGTSLLVSEKTRDRFLEDDTVYSRYNVLAITPKTLESAVLNRMNPMIHAGPGGYCVEVDAEAIRRRRIELGLSIGEIAEMIGTSRRTVYGYERGMAKASVSATYNLIRTLGIPVARTINILEDTHRRGSCRFMRALVRNKLLRRIFRKLSQCRVTAVKKAPFDFLVVVPEGEMRIVGGIVDWEEPTLSKRVDEIVSVSDIMRGHPVLIMDERRPLDQVIPCILGEEISKIRKAEDLIARAQ